MLRRLLCLVCASALLVGMGVTPATAQSGMTPPEERPAAPQGVAQPKEARPAAEFTASAVDDSFPGDYRSWYSAINDTVDREDDFWDIFPIYLEAGENVQIDLAMTTGDADLYIWAPGTTSTGATWWGVSVNGGTVADRVSGIIPAGQAGYWYVGVQGFSSTVSNYTLTTETVPDNPPFGAPDDYLPGPAMPASLFNVYLDSFSENAEIFSIPLLRGETLTVTASRVDGALTSTGFDPWIMLFPPSATTIFSPAVPGTYRDDTTSLPKTFTYTATSTGTYPLVVWHSEGWTRQFGTVRITYSIDNHSVYRFYNPKAGVHFYTATVAERDTVMNTLSSIWQYEAAVYRAPASLNTSTLWRFYRPSTGTHFYTADPAEKSNVQNNLAGTYSYDGPAYNVSTGSGGTTVWRFYNRRTGTHFYTADPTERDHVRDTLSYIYLYENAAFYVNQN